jgi:sec-independent protein translocase protein TatA
LIVLVIAVAVFGAGRLAGVGAALGNSVRDFRKAVKEDDAPVDAKPALRDGEVRAVHRQ